VCDSDSFWSNEGGNMNSYQHSRYYNNEEFIQLMQNSTSPFTLLTLNCQSLNAKFQDLQIYVENYAEVGCPLSVICLQETWLSDNSDTSLFQMENYTLLSKGKSCSVHGGTAIYIHNSYAFNELKPDITSELYDGQFIEVSTKCSQASNLDTYEKLVIINLYIDLQDQVLTTYMLLLMT
jgi:exonuclease III